MKLLIVLSFLFGVPLIELFLFIEAGEQIGAFSTIVATIVTATTGIRLAKKQGMQALKTTKLSFNMGKLPIHETLNGVGILVAALMLFIPGFFTDLIGLCLFIPKFRLFLMNKIFESIIYKINNATYVQSPSVHSDPRHGPIIDGKAKPTANITTKNNI
jgi:UPF0716 protein FxsA